MRVTLFITKRMSNLVSMKPTSKGVTKAVKVRHRKMDVSHGTSQLDCFG